MTPEENLNDQIKQQRHADELKSVREVQKAAAKDGKPVSRQQAREFIQKQAIAQAAEEQKAQQRVADALAEAVPAMVKMGKMFGPQEEEPLNIDGCDGGGKNFRVRRGGDGDDMPKDARPPAAVGSTTDMIVIIGGQFYQIAVLTEGDAELLPS